MLSKEAKSVLTQLLDIATYNQLTSKLKGEFGARDLKYDAIQKLVPDQFTNLP